MPYLTSHIPGIGGQLKSEPADFFVEEIPLYLPSGQGQHIYVTIEKKGLSTYAAMKMIARALDIPVQAIGHAGLKDAQAVTRQMLSIDGVDPHAVEKLEWPNLKILQITPHRNKLKIGHLAGNRFVIRVRGVEPEALAGVHQVLKLLTEQGVPNFFGEQRFGHRNNNHRLGELIIQQNAPEFVAEFLGRPQPEETPPVRAARELVEAGRWAEALAQWPGQLTDERRVLAAIVRAEGDLQISLKALDNKLKNFFVSAFQGGLFNELLAQRLNRLGQLEEGDVAYLHSNGAAFVVETAAIEQPRADRFEISPAGPLFGPKLLQAQRKPGEREQAMLSAHGLTLESFKQPGLKLRGVRRSYRLPLKTPQVWEDEGIVVSFELPPGAYATTVMAEIMKN